MENLLNSKNFEKNDIFVIKYFAIISIFTASTYAIFYIVFLHSIYLFALNLTFVALYFIFWYTGIHFKKWYFAYIITFINMLHVFIYVYFLFGFDINYNYYFLMYPMAMLTVRESRIDIIKIITIIISVLLFVVREILGNRLEYIFSFSYLASRIINVFVITSLMLGLSFMIYSYIIKLNKVKKELYKQSTTDQLTGLYNRRYLFEQYNKNDLSSEDKICIMIIDIDDFKIINDVHGHFVGDKVIKSVADVMVNTVNGNGVVGRIGGEEFCVILTNSSKGIFSKLSEEIRSNIANARIQVENGKVVSCTVSVGIACQREFNYPFNKLFVSADKAMYTAKNHGKNRVELFAG